MIRNTLTSLSAFIALAACSFGTTSSAVGTVPLGPLERGVISGWNAGDAVVYGTVGFFSPNPQIVAIGAVKPDGSFTVDYPAVLPQDVLVRPSAQCSTIQASNPIVLTAFTGNDLIFQRGKLIGSIHSGSSLGVASFTSIAGGDTRTGYVYASADTTQTGYCERTVKFGTYAVDFRQTFELNLRKGWNMVVADFSMPAPGHIVSDLKLGANSAERFYFFAGARCGGNCPRTHNGSRFN